MTAHNLPDWSNPSEWHWIKSRAHDVESRHRDDRDLPLMTIGDSEAVAFLRDGHWHTAVRKHAVSMSQSDATISSNRPGGSLSE